MVKYNEIKLSYTCFAYPPENIHMDRVYSIGKDSKGFYFTDGDYVQHVKDDELWFIKMLFTPNDVDWSEVDFEDKVKLSKTR